MNLAQIKQAVSSGKTVHWKNIGYIVTLVESKGVEHWGIRCLMNNHSIGLTNADETKLNGNEEDFFIA